MLSTVTSYYSNYVKFSYHGNTIGARIISWRFLCLNFSPDCVAISTDIAIYVKDVNIWFKGKLHLTKNVNECSLN